MVINKEELRQRNKDTVQKAALFWIELANKRQSEIEHELLAISAVLLPLSVSFVSTNVILDTTGKLLLSVSWILLLISIVMGFLQILIDSDFFLKLSRDSSKREVIWSDFTKDFEKANKEVEALGRVPGSSAMWPLYVQGISFFVGVLMLTIIGFSLVSKQSRLDNQLPIHCQTEDCFKSPRRELIKIK